jgi:XTP/dITP diphosphohydrolase
MNIVFATHNKNKILEVQKMLPESIKILSLQDISQFEEIPETGKTIEENAIIKANFITEKFGYDCIADDSGLEINFLNGEPGVHSARYAGEHRNDTDNMNLVLKKLKNTTERTAQFKTVIALKINKNQYLFNGIAKGNITLSKFGNEGFGYDPIFKPEGFDKTFAEMSLTEKNAISHRGKAIQLLLSFLKKCNF